MGGDRNPIPRDRAAHHDKRLADRRIEVKRFPSRRCFLDLSTHAANDILGSVNIPDDTAKRLFDFIQIRRVHFQEPHSCTGIVARRSNGVQDFVRQRGSQLTHRVHAIDVGEIRLHLLQSRQRLCAILDVG